MAKLNKIMPPRNTTIRGQDHLLAYITPEEAQMLMDNGGAGKPGPMGIPAFYGEDPGFDGGGGGSAQDGDDTGGFGGGGYGEDPGFDGGGGGSSQDDYGGGGGNDGNDTISRAAAKDFGTPDPTQEQITQSRGFDTGTQASRDAIMGLGQLSEIDALKQLNADLYDLSRREQRMKEVMQISPVLGYVGLQNVRNLAQLASGYPTGFLSSLGLADRYVGSGRTPAELAALQSRNLRGPTGRDPFGRTTSGIKAITDEFGNVIQGVDPRPDVLDTQGGYDDHTAQTVRPPNPATGQCDEGYIFDTDLQACRLDTGGDQPSTGGATFAPGAYARMGLLDQAPTGLPEFQQRYGAGFGTRSEFTDANLAFRRQGAYRPQYFDQPYPPTGYTLLS